MQPLQDRHPLPHATPGLPLHHSLCSNHAGLPACPLWTKPAPAQAPSPSFLSMWNILPQDPPLQHLTEAFPDQDGQIKHKTLS